MKKKKITKTLISFLLACSLAFSFVACSDNGQSNAGSGSQFPSGSTDEDPYVEELVVVIDPVKTRYLPNQSFDPTGMVLVARWNHGVEEELNPGEYTVSPEKFSAGDTKVTFLYEGATGELPVTVQGMDSIEVYDLTVDRSAIFETGSAGHVDFTKLVVKAVYEAGGTPETVQDYVLTDNGVEVVDKKTHFLTVGEHEMTVKYGKDKSQTFNVSCPYIQVEGENVYTDVDLADQPNVKNYVQLSEGNLSVGGIGDWQVDNVDIGQFASGEKAVKGMTGGEAVTFHVWSETDCQATISLSAASAQTLVNNDAWGPDQTADVKFNDALTLEVNDSVVSVSDGVVYDGHSRTSGMGSYSLLFWTQEEDLGVIDLKKGDNVITFTCVGKTAAVTGAHPTSSTVGLTIDYIKLIPFEAGAEITGLEIVTEPAKIEYLSGQTFDSAGMKLVAKYDTGTERTLHAGEYTTAPSVLSVGDTKVTFTYKGFSVELRVTVREMSSIALDSLTVDRSAIPTQTATDTFDFNQLVVQAVAAGGGASETVTDYVLTDNGATVSDRTNHYLGLGEHTIAVVYGDKTQTFTVDCTHTLIEAENLGSNGKNYVEIYDADGRELGIGRIGDWEITETGINPPSGGASLEDIRTGDVITFHVYSDVECDVILSLSAASQQTVIMNDAWGPDRTADVKFNDVFMLNVNGSAVSVSDDVVYEGRTRTDGMGKYSLFYWSALKELGTIHLNAGDNVITFTASVANATADKGGESQMAFVSLTMDCIKLTLQQST